MSAQYAKFGDRCFVNGDFVKNVRELFSTTTRRIPLGYQTYVGWTGKDEVLFTKHDGVEGLDGEVYEVTWDPVNPGSFHQQILPAVSHTSKTGKLHVARSASGLYGYAKAIQATCESAARKLNKEAGSIMRHAVAKDEAVVPFLQVHASRTDSTPARVLLAAYRESLPKVGKLVHATRKLGLYGYPARTAKLGLGSCSSLREAAGVLAADLHVKRGDQFDKITGFFGEHCKAAGCNASGLLLSSYPEKEFRFRRASRSPMTVDDWLQWNGFIG